MQIPLLGQRRFRSLFPLAAWTCAAVAAWWLYHGGVGTGHAVGVAEVREYKVSSVDLGRLASLEVTEGQRVSAGQVLARFETELMQKEIAVAEARLRQLASEASAAGVSLDIGVLESERNFESELEAVAVELETAQSGSARDRAELNMVLQELQRARELVRRGLAKADRISELGLRRAGLEESANAWPPRIATLESRRRSAEARLSEWRRAHSEAKTGGSRATVLQPILDKVREQQEVIQLLKARLRNATLLAACEAYVSRILARPGDVVKPGDPVVMLVEVGPRQVVAYLEERRGYRLHTGAKVVARRRGQSREQFGGTVVTVAGNVSQLPTRLSVNPNIAAWGREVYIELPPGIRLDPGEALDITWLDRSSSGGRQVAADSRKTQLAAN